MRVLIAFSDRKNQAIRSSVVEVEELIGRVLRQCDLTTIGQQIVRIDVNQRDAVSVVRHMLDDQSASDRFV